jgi:hypothetical protein
MSQERRPAAEDACDRRASRRRGRARPANLSIAKMCGKIEYCEKTVGQKIEYCETVLRKNRRLEG